MCSLAGWEALQPFLRIGFRLWSVETVHRAPGGGGAVWSGPITTRGKSREGLASGRAWALGELGVMWLLVCVA